MIIDKEFAELIPPLTEEEYKGLESSIVSEGCRDALVCWGEILIDGHNRYKICEEHGIEYRTIEREFSGRDEVLLWIMKNQLSRRNLNDFQRIEIVRKCENAVKAQAEERQKETRFGGGGKISTTVRENLPTPGRATEELGAMAGVSRKTYEHATAVIDNAPETVKEAVRKQEISINAGYEATKLPPEKQAEITTRIENGEKAKDAVKAVISEVRAHSGVSPQAYERAVQVIETAPEDVKEELRKGNISINQAYQRVKNMKRKADLQRQVEELEQSAPSVPDGLFDVIVMDPPWAYGTGYDAAGRRCANPYPEMTQSELKAIEIPSSENCVLFLWTTHRFIWDAKELLDVWGFEYRNMLVWDKKVMGMGNLFRMRCEFCLVGIKGKPLFKDAHNIEDIITEQRREHSRKPEAFYEMVNALCVGRKLDYFSRTKRDGWEVFGNDTEKFSVA